MNQIFCAYPDCHPTVNYFQLKPAFKDQVKSTPEAVVTWLEANPKFFENTQAIKGTTRWCRITYYSRPANSSEAYWKENCGIICTDEKSEYVGNIYKDERKSFLYLKFFQLTLATPIYAVTKTIYHLTLGWFFAIAKSYREKNAPPLSHLMTRNLMDIARTPLYGAIITLTTLTGLLVIPFNPTLSYDTRAFVGNLTIQLLWGRTSFMNLNPCMLRTANFLDLIKTESFSWNPDKGPVPN